MTKVRGGACLGHWSLPHLLYAPLLRLVYQWGPAPLPLALSQEPSSLEGNLEKKTEEEKKNGKGANFTLTMQQ